MLYQKVKLFYLSSNIRGTFRKSNQNGANEFSKKTNLAQRKLLKTEVKTIKESKSLSIKNLRRSRTRDTLRNIKITYELRNESRFLCEI